MPVRRSLSALSLALEMCLALAGTSAAILLPSPALADEKPEIVQAREDFRDGVARMTADDFAGALAKFKSVAKVKMNAQVAFNMAECEDHLGQLVEALGNYRLAATKAQDGQAPEVAKAVDDRINKLKKRIPKLTLTKNEPTPNPRAVIQLDGNDVAAAQLGTPMQVDPGQRIATVVVAGRVVGTSRITLEDGAEKSLKLEIPAPIEIDDSDLPGGGTSSRGPSGPGIAMVSVGGAALIAGFVGIGVRQAAIGSLNQLCKPDHSCPSSSESTGQPIVNRGRIATGIAEVSLPVGTVAAVIGVVLLATHGRSRAKDSAPAALTFVPAAPGSDVAGGSLVGRF